MQTMINEDVNGFLSRLPEKGRLLGLDLGAKTIGLALSDVSRQIATPLETLKRTRFADDADKLSELYDTHSVIGIVLGFPVNMNGTQGPRCQASRDFARNLLSCLQTPILLWDERLSTAAVTHTLLAADLSRNKRAKVIDKMAAGYILQGALDALKHLEVSER